MSALLQAQNSTMALALTITLHWWMLPALLLVAALVFWIKAERARDPCFGGMFEAITAIALVLMALMVCVGHWL